MKKRTLTLLLAAALLAVALCGCGGSDAAVTEMAYDEAASAPAEYAGAAAYGADGGTYAAPQSAESRGENGAKIIYTAQLDMESTDFDGAVEALAALTEDCGGYYESSQISNWSGGSRYASFTVRVPVERYRDFLDRAGALCHLLNRYEYADDVSEVYYDTAGRLETQETKLSRLRELLARAEDMEDIIAIESAISETEETIESLTGELRRYDARVDYATVTVSLDEVYRLSGDTEPAGSFPARLGAAFAAGCRSFGEGMENLLLALAHGWIWILLVIAAAVIIAVAVRRKKKKARQRGPEKKTSAGSSHENHSDR